MTAVVSTSRTLRSIAEHKVYSQRATIEAHTLTIAGIAAAILLFTMAGMLLPDKFPTAPLLGFIQPDLSLGQSRISISEPVQLSAKQQTRWSNLATPKPVTAVLTPESHAATPVQPATIGSGTEQHGAQVPLSNGGQHNGTTQFQTSTIQQQPEAIPSPDEDGPLVEKEPVVDLRTLQRLVIYPEMAIIAKIEGVVFVSVFIGADGLPKQTRIDRSPSDLLSAAAIAAIMKGTYIAAEQNGRNVGCWVAIPIHFRLK